MVVRGVVLRDDIKHEPAGYYAYCSTTISYFCHLLLYIMSEERSLNFLEEIVEEDISAGKHGGRVLTRFPPEPNGYLHIGHAKSICLNFGLALKYGGKTNLRFDDTNPVKEDVEYVDSIKEDVKWLGFEWANELYASDYFDIIYAFAMNLIRKGL